MTRSKLRYRGLSAETRRLLTQSGEAGRFEFKQEAEAVSVGVLVAAANACLLEHTASVTILVGVEELEDPVTGMVSGRIMGLPKLERARAVITSRGSQTLPVPVGLRIIEENTGTTRPVLALEVTPTRPPHYDAKGTRSTRYGASTRAITDEELLDLYLDREAVAFERRFRATATALLDQLQHLTVNLDFVDDRIGDATRSIEELAGSLGQLNDATEATYGAADEGQSLLESLDEAIGWVRSQLDEIQNSPRSLEEAWYLLRRQRQLGWLNFEMYRKATGATLREVEEILRRVIGRPTDILDYVRNVRELEAWYRIPPPEQSVLPDRWTEWAQEINAETLDAPASWVPRTLDEMEADRRDELQPLVDEVKEDRPRAPVRRDPRK